MTPLGDLLCFWGQASAKDLISSELNRGFPVFGKTHCLTHLLNDTESSSCSSSILALIRDLFALTNAVRLTRLCLASLNKLSSTGLGSGQGSSRLLLDGIAAFQPHSRTCWRMID